MENSTTESLANISYEKWLKEFNKLSDDYISGINWETVIWNDGEIAQAADDIQCDAYRTCYFIKNEGRESEEDYDCNPTPDEEEWGDYSVSCDERSDFQNRLQEKWDEQLELRDEQDEARYAIKIISVEMDQDETVNIITEGCDEKHEWNIQTTQGKFDSSMGCLEFLNCQEFDPDELTEIESAHYEAANTAFDENAEKLYDEREEGIFIKRDSCFYAEISYKTENVQYLGEIQTPPDLFRFETEKERDDFVDESKASSISTEEASQNHPNQFNYWENN